MLRKKVVKRRIGIVLALRIGDEVNVGVRQPVYPGGKSRVVTCKSILFKDLLSILRSLPKVIPTGKESDDFKPINIRRRQEDDLRCCGISCDRSEVIEKCGG